MDWIQPLVHRQAVKATGTGGSPSRTFGSFCDPLGPVSLNDNRQQFYKGWNKASTSIHYSIMDYSKKNRKSVLSIMNTIIENYS